MVGKAVTNAVTVCVLAEAVIVCVVVVVVVDPHGVMVFAMKDEQSCSPTEGPGLAELALT